LAAGDVAEATGMLVNAGDGGQLAAAVMALLTHPQALSRMARNAAADARQRFTIDRQADQYLDWYADLRR
jgi:glycosyltransferase involved in cell wall biosynthesis